MQNLHDILFRKRWQVEDPALLHECYALSYILFYALLVHIVFFGYFAYVGMYAFLLYNVASVLFYFLFLFRFHWRTAVQKDRYSMLASLEVVAYGVVTTACFGWESGSQWFIIAAILPYYLFLRTGSGLRRFLTLTGLAALLGVFCYTVAVPSHNAVSGTAAYRFLNMAAVASALLLEAMMGDIVNKTTAGQIKELQRDAQVDPLTGLWNRRFADHFFKEMARESYPCSVAMLDIDHFKEINDRYGHPVGDEVLKKLSTLLTRSFRSSDVIIRWGGEEFLIVLRGSSAEAVRSILENLRATIENTRFSVSSQVLFFTVTIGVAWCGPGGETAIEKAVEESDRCLYQGKRNGRNQVVFAPVPQSDPP